MGSELGSAGQAPTREDILLLSSSKELTLNCSSHSCPASLHFLHFLPSILWHIGTSGQRLAGGRKKNRKAAEFIYKTPLQQWARQEPGPPGAHRWVKNEDQWGGKVKHWASSHRALTYLLVLVHIYCRRWKMEVGVWRRGEDERKH